MPVSAQYLINVKSPVCKFPKQNSPDEGKEVVLGGPGNFSTWKCNKIAEGSTKFG